MRFDYIMKFAITGVTGFIGTHLSHYLQNKGHVVFPITRQDFLLDNRNILKERLAQSDCIINLAGAPINRKWTKRYKQELYDSRIQTTRTLVEMINDLENPPKCFISTSAVGYYAPHTCYSEFSAENGTDFLSQLCRAWEYEVSKLRDDIRCIITRFGIVMSEKGGMYSQMSAPARLIGIAICIGNGDNYISWIHLDDLIHALYLLALHHSANGIFNLTAPQSITQHYLIQLISTHYHTFFILKIAPFLLKPKFGEGISLFTQDLCVKPDKLMMMGFRFSYPYIDDFISELG